MKKEGYRKLTEKEIEILKNAGCESEDFSRVKIKNTDISKIKNVRFEGDVYIGELNGCVKINDKISLNASIENATIIDCTLGDNVFIRNVKRHIINYEVGNGVIIDNVNVIEADEASAFAMGEEIMPLNEGGGRSVPLYSEMTAQSAYLFVLYRDRDVLMKRLKDFAETEKKKYEGVHARIDDNASIVDTATISNVFIYPYAKVFGATSLSKGLIQSEKDAPSYVGPDVIMKNFLLSESANVLDAANVENAFIGEAVNVGKGFTLENALTFANSEFYAGEAASILAGPYTVTHHKATLLIALMLSFSNAGSATNQSNHMYKLGALHQGVFERGVKTGSSSYMLMPFKIAAFSVVIGKHTARFDSSNLPFSYIISENEQSVLFPGKNLFSSGRLRDERKWISRDKRKKKKDVINFKALSPYTASKMLLGLSEMKGLYETLSSPSDYANYKDKNLRIPGVMLRKGINAYKHAVKLFIGDTIFDNIDCTFESVKNDYEIHLNVPSFTEWIDALGQIMPKERLSYIINETEKGEIKDFRSLNEAFYNEEKKYKEYEKKYAYSVFEEVYGKSIVSDKDTFSLFLKDYAKALDYMLNEVRTDAKNEFGKIARISYGCDGNEDACARDFYAVRGAIDENGFLKDIEEEVRKKKELLAL